MAILRVCTRCASLDCDCKAKAEREWDRRRPSASQRGYDARWRGTRAKFLSVFPICQHEDGCINTATDVHHLDGMGPKGERGHDWSNLLALCHSHHSRITGQMQPGGFNR